MSVIKCIKFVAEILRKGPRGQANGAGLVDGGTERQTRVLEEVVSSVRPLHEPLYHRFKVGFLLCANTVAGDFPVSYNL